MDLLRETAPFLIGTLLPPLLILVIQLRWSSRGKFLTIFLAALVLGAATSALAGELSGELADGLIAILIDTSLVYCGSQFAYQLFWKPTVEARLRCGQAQSMQLEKARR